MKWTAEDQIDKLLQDIRTNMKQEFEGLLVKVSQ
jgi:hypothetical protein